MQLHGGRQAYHARHPQNGQGGVQRNVRQQRNPPVQAPANGPNGGGQGLQPALIPPPAAPPVRRFGVGYIAAAMAWEPHVKDKSNAQEYAKSVLGKTGIVVESVTASRHPLQAMERTLCIIEALICAYRQGKRNLLNVYADNRESKFNDKFNLELAPGETPMNIHRYAPTIVHKDIHRTPTDTPWETLVARADCLLYVDIYQQHNSETRVFDPEYVVGKLLELPVQQHCSVLYWVGRRFYGDIGVVPKNTMDTKGKTAVWAEGAWKRDKDGLISFWSSPAEGSEYKHDPCDWIWKATSCLVNYGDHRYKLTWSQLRVVGSMYVISFSVDTAIVKFEPCPWFKYETQLQELELPSTSGLKTFCRAWLPRFLFDSFNLSSKQLFYKPFLEPAAEFFCNKRQAQVNTYGVIAKLKEARDLKEVRIVHECFPELYPQTLESVALAVMSANSRDRYTALVDNIQQFGTIHAGINSYLTAYGTAPLSKPVLPSAPILTVAFAGLCATYFYLRHKSVKIKFATSILQTYLSCRDERVDVRPFLPTPTRLWKDPGAIVKWCSSAIEQGTKLIQSDSPISFTSPSIDWGKVLVTYFNYCIFAPAWEEYAKTSPLLRYALPLGEFALYVYPNPTPFNIAGRLVALAAHFWFVATDDVKEAIFRHSSWNFTVTTLSIIFDPTVQAQFSSFLTFRVQKQQTAITKLRMAGTCVAMAAIAGYRLYCLYDYTKRELIKDRYQQWRHDYYETPWEDRPVPTREVESFICPVDKPSVETALASVPTRPKETENHFLNEINWIPDLVRNPSYFYHILPTCVPGYVPATNYFNLNASITARMLIEPPMLPSEQQAFWGALLEQGHYKRFARCLSAQQDGKWETMTYADWDEIVDDWLLHFEGDKLRKYRKEVQRIRDGLYVPHVPKTTEIFLKSNEMLMGSKDGKMALKPRFISNVDADFQAYVGPYIYIAQKRLAETCPTQGCGRWYDEDLDCYFSLSYGGCAKDTELSSWMDDFINGRLIPEGKRGIAIIVLGDDCAAGVQFSDGTRIFIETDFKKYDSTQGRGPMFLQKIISVIFFGMPLDISQLIYELSGSARIVIPKHLKDHLVFVVQCLERWFRHSGGADTSFGNSVVTLFAWFMVYTWMVDEVEMAFNDGTLEDLLSKYFGDLGFEITIKIYKEPHQFTFLKGMWYPHDNAYVWAPLPSRILKAGKSLRDPRELFPGTTMEEACLAFLNGIAAGQAVYLQVPILRAFVKRYAKGSPIASNSPWIEVNPYATVGTGAYAQWPMCDSMMDAVCQRYDITLSDIYRVETMIEMSNALTFLSDPVFVALWELDYT